MLPRIAALLRHVEWFFVIENSENTFDSKVNLKNCKLIVIMNKQIIDRAVIKNKTKNLRHTTPLYKGWKQINQ